jgi:ribosomal protein S12 methylthiotransferase accessory factor
MADETIEVFFPGGKQVAAQVGDFLIHTDQSVKYGGGGSAPEPFDLFLASIAACAGIFALGFCQKRDIDTGQLKVRMECDRDPVKKMYSHFRLCLTLPPEFPEKYRSGIIKAVELCTVKRHIFDPPEFQVVVDN